MLEMYDNATANRLDDNDPVSYASYAAWDNARRVKYPIATHWIYQSRIGEFKVAEWNINFGAVK